MREIIDKISACRKKLNIARMLNKLVLFAIIGCGVAAVLELCALFFPMYGVNELAIIVIAGFAFLGLVFALFTGVTMSEAAKKLDTFGLKERMLTAYECRDKTGEIVECQRADAIRTYENCKNQIKIKVMPHWKLLLGMCVSIATVILISYIPAPAKEIALERQEVKKLAKEEEKEVDKMLDALEEIQTDTLTEEQKELLKSLTESMELSKNELANAKTNEGLSQTMEKLNYKYEQTASQLADMKELLENADEIGLTTASEIASANSAEMQMASNQLNSGGNNQSGNNQGGNNQNGNNQGGNNQSGNNQNGNNQGGNNQNGNNQNGNNQGGNNQGGNNQGGNNQSGNNQSGNSNGNGEGQGEGQGEGNGNGGQGTGEGGGRGTGSGSGTHDYVSIPNDIGDDPSISGQKNGNQDSDYFRQENGLAWEGEHVEYSSVIQEYTDQAYEGITNGRYPSGMENVIKDYFESLN